MKFLGAIDIGGTNVKFGLASSEGIILSKSSIPYNPQMPFWELTNLICQQIENLIKNSRIEINGIGISVPGYAHPQTGILLDGANNVPSLKGESLTLACRKYFNIPSFIENDGICAALGELLFGAGRSYNNFVVITLGTGIGGGVIIDRKIVKGVNDEPPEIGAICLNPNGPKNYSGIPGTFESLAGASGILELYQKLSGGRYPCKTIPEIFLAAAAGEKVASLTVDQIGQYIAQALGIMINLLNLEACIIGGGISAAGNLLLEAVQKNLPSFTWPLLLKKVRILLAELGNDAGLLGAAAMALRKIELDSIT